MKWTSLFSVAMCPVATMMPRFASFTVGVMLIGGLAGCGSDPDLYTVASVAGPVISASEASTLRGIGPQVVEVRTPVVTAALDRDEIVRQDRDYQLKIAKGDSWAQPVGEMIGRALTLDLAQRLPGVTVFAQNDAIETEPQAFVEVTITAFNENQQGQAVIQGGLSVHASQESIGPVQVTPFYETLSLSSHGTGELVYALSQLIARVADRAALQIRSLPEPR